MQKIFHIVFTLFSVFLLFSFIYPISAQNNQYSHVSGSVIYQDTCNPEFHVDFDISNLSITTSPVSYFSIILSSHLELVNWYSTPEIPDLQVRVFEIGDPVLNKFGQSISTENVIIEVYNYSFADAESVKITMFFELTLYQSTIEWIKYNLVMFPKIDSNQTTSPIVTDPEISDIINQQGYPVYELTLPINDVTVEGFQDDLDIVPEFSSLIFISMFLIMPLFILVFRKRLNWIKAK